MSRRAVQWIAFLALIDVVTLALTIHANLTFHRTPTGPRTMTEGQMLGWVIVVLDTILLGFVVMESRRSGRGNRRR